MRSAHPDSRTTKLRSIREKGNKMPTSSEPQTKIQPA